MSIFDIKMPKLGESITEGTIISWAVKAGDTIQEDDKLFEVTTAKVSAEIPSPVAGKIIKLFFKEGDTVAVGTVVASVQLEGEEVEEASGESEAIEQTKQESAPEVRQNDASKAVKATAPKKEEAKWYSPIVLEMANQAKISIPELDGINGTGYLGRLSKKDLNEYIEQKAKNIPSMSISKPVPVASETILPVVSEENDNYEIREMDPVRRIIADHMVLSKKTSPHVTTIVEADVTKLVAWRARNKETFFKQEGIQLTYMPAIVEATAKALKEFPQVNASVDGYRMILKKHIHVGLAVSLNDGNLIVPVIHDADKLSVSGLAVAIESLARKARANKLKTADIEGGTFSITNFGTFKSIIGTPIINQPQVAILGVGYIEKKPAVLETPEGDVIAIRHKMYLSLSYDHRIVDGALGGQFLRRIADHLENWPL